MMTKVKKVICLFIGMMSFFLASGEVRATTLQDLYNDMAALEKSYNAAKNKAAMTEAELKNVKANIASIEAQIKNTQQEITQAEKDIVSSEQEIEKKKE